MEMEEKHLMDIMIPLKDYAVVSQDAAIKEALRIMKESSERLSPEKVRHLGILVKDEEGNIVGKLTQADILRGLVPDYKDIGGSRLAPMMRAEMGEIMTHLSDKTFLGRCKAQKEKKVRDFMTTVALSVDVNKGLGHALHLMQSTGHIGLLVTGKGKKPIGMLRLTDIYRLVEEAILEN
jgi:predicted transcriptional regulator